jgi:AAA domain
LTGEPGIGKSSVAKFIANYLKARDGDFIKNGVIFLNVINCSSSAMLKHKFVNAFKEGLEKQIFKKLENKQDTEDMFSQVLSILSRIEILLIIDDAEDLLRTSKNMLKSFIESLFEASSTIRVLLTSKIELISFLGGINGVKGGVIKMKPLTLMASEKLLSEKSGRTITREEKSKLQSMQPERVHSGCKSAYHHLFEVILGGHPIAINLAANIFSSGGLEFLYETLAKSSLMNTLAKGTIGKSTINTQLRFSLKLTLRLLKDKDVFLFFNLMGYFPGGIEEEVIDSIWPKVKRKATTLNWKEYYHFLAKASLATKKKTKVNKETQELYVLVPMLKTLAEEFRSIHERKKVHRIVTTYYVKVLEGIMDANSISHKGNEELMNTLWHHEMNIWD